MNTPEGVPRLFDLVMVQDEKMKLAFFAALGNTIVAKDIDQVDSFSACILSSSFSFSLSGLWVFYSFLVRGEET